MCRNVDGQISHGERQVFEEFGIEGLQRANRGSRVVPELVAVQSQIGAWFSVSDFGSRWAKWAFCRCDAREG